MITDVLLLADVIHKYREMCWQRSGLEALSYVSLPQLTFDACLKLTRQKLQIVKDINILQMIESGIKGMENYYFFLLSIFYFFIFFLFYYFFLIHNTIKNIIIIFKNNCHIVI